MTFSKSEKIDQWFATNSEGDRYDWFWKFIDEVQPYDSIQDSEDYRDELMERGFLLGAKAAEAVRPTFFYDVDTSFHNSQLYFIGQESEVLDRLQDCLDRWLKKYPQGTEEEKKQSELKKQIERAEQELRSKQLDLTNLQQQQKEIK